MGPPIFIGGNAYILLYFGLHLRLQWGRRFSSAEMGRRPGQGPLHKPRFNGAADFHRRKCDME